MANLGDGLQQTFPFMKLPPELRLVVYELVMRSYLEDVDRTNFLQCGRPGIGSSLEVGNKMWEARAREVAEFEGKRTSKAAPYLGALALLHTSKMVYWESYYAMRDVVSCHRAACFDIMTKAFVPMSKALWGQDSQTARLLRYEHDKTEAIWSYVMMISKSFANTYPRHLSDYLAVTFHGNLHGRARKSAQSTTDPDEHTDSEAGIAWDATLMAAVKYFPNIYASIQRRLESGDGVRTSFKAEVKLLADWEITNDEVAIMTRVSPRLALL